MSARRRKRGPATRVGLWLVAVLSGALVAAAVLVASVALAASRAPRAGAAGAADAPALSVTAACLLDPSSGEVLFSSNGDAQLAIASTTKLMTALVTLQQIHHLGQSFTQNDWDPASQDSQIGLAPGERMSVHDLLIALLLPSADDAAEDLADNIGDGSIARFVGMMNAEARTLGLTHTHYTTPIGLDTPGNHSSACDLVRLAAYDMRISPFFRRVVALPGAELHSGRYPRHVVNTDDLVGRVPWIQGIKTGHTADAGYVLVSQGEQHGLTLIGSVLGTSSEATRDANALSLLQYGFSTFHEVTAVAAGAVLARRPERDLSRTAPVIASRSFRSLLSVHDRVRVVVHLPRVLTGPLRRHAVVGEATVLVNGRPAATIPLEVARAVPAVSTLRRVASFLIRPSTLILLAIAFATAGALAGIRRRGLRAIATGRLEEG